jgi:hypothetical protein
VLFLPVVYIWSDLQAHASGNNVPHGMETSKVVNKNEYTHTSSVADLHRKNVDADPNPELVFINVWARGKRLVKN